MRPLEIGEPDGRLDLLDGTAVHASLKDAPSRTLRVPADVPVKEFWAVTVYDFLTRSMIKTDTMKAGVPSQDDLRVNADGSTDIHFGPEAPEHSG